MSEETVGGSHALLRHVEALAPTIDAAVREIERRRELPGALFDALVERDLFRLLLPGEYGGQEAAPPAFVRFVEAIGKHDASTAWCLGQNNVCATVAAYLEPDTAREVFDGPRAVLAWGPGPGEAQAVDDGYLLSGAFQFASGSRHATWLGAHVPVRDARGRRRAAADGTPATHTLVFPRAAAHVEDTWDVLGLKGTGSDSYRVETLFVPARRAVARGLSSRPRIDRPLYAFTPSTLYASSFAGIALGLARATLEAFVAQLRDTVSRGASKTRGQNNVVQSQVGQAEARLRSSRMFLLGSLDAIWADVRRTGDLAPEHRLTIRLASTWAIQQSREVITSLYLAAGALAIFASQPFERRLRDIHTLSQQIQGHAAHFETVGQVLMGVEPERPLFTF